MRALLLLLLMLNGIGEPVATYRGVRYTPSSYPQATWHEDPMCRNIRAQWIAQGWQPNQQSSQASSRKASVSNIGAEGFIAETYRVCVGKDQFGNCLWETRTRLVRVHQSPTPAPRVANEAESDYTPHAAVKKAIDLLQLQKGEMFYDVGCGDGRFIVEASKRGAIGIGIEIDGQRYKQSRRNIEGLSTAAVFYGDYKDFDLTKADAVALYQHSDVLQDIASRLAPGTRYVSYSHDIPGMNSQFVVVDGERIYYGEIPRSFL